MKKRIDEEMTRRGMVQSRSQAQGLIKMGKVRILSKVITKPHYPVAAHETISIENEEKYVSRAGFKLASVAAKFKLSFAGTTVLDVGSSTGGFTDYALRSGANKVIAVDVGTDQLHPSLRGNRRIDLREKTDIRKVEGPLSDVDIVVIDVSFISLRDILPHIKSLLSKDDARVVAMMKPQFETGEKTKNKGVIKNDTIRRRVLKDFELWVKKYYVVLDKADSDVAGTKGNLERFYLLKPINN